jgi:hypothetical protein
MYIRYDYQYDSQFDYHTVISLLCSFSSVIRMPTSLLKINLISPWYSWKIAELALNNTHPDNEVGIRITLENEHNKEITVW